MLFCPIDGFMFGSDGFVDGDNIQISWMILLDWRPHYHLVALAVMKYKANLQCQRDTVN